VRDILKVLTLLSLLASIGSFIIAADNWQNGQHHAPEHSSVKQQKDNRNDMRMDSEGFSRESAIEVCVKVIAVCGAGLAVSRLIS
jgi:hypothetical protein